MKIIKKCEICDKHFTPTTRGKKGRAFRFCSNECKFKYQKEHPPVPKSGIYKICEWCNSKFYVQQNEIRYRCCSSKCGNLNKASKGLHHSNLYTKGYYKSKVTGNKEHYDSSYELIRMEQLDEMKVIWTKHHKIAIPYKDNKNEIHHYIPDFLIDNKIIEEVKPRKIIKSNYLNTKIKLKAGRKYCKENGYKFRIITEKELGIK
jgi:hypothetical protein